MQKPKRSKEIDRKTKWKEWGRNKVVLSQRHQQPPPVLIWYTYLYICCENSHNFIENREEKAVYSRHSWFYSVLMVCFFILRAAYALKRRASVVKDFGWTEENGGMEGRCEAPFASSKIVHFDCIWMDMTTWCWHRTVNRLKSFSSSAFLCCLHNDWSVRNTQ